MKKHQFLLFVMACLFSLTMYAVSDQQSNASGSQITLQGELQSSGFRSGTHPVVAELQDKTLSAYFHKNVGMLQITVVGVQGEVFVTYVDTAVQSALSIPLAGVPAGNYTVTFSNERGNMWGEFEI